MLAIQEIRRIRLLEGRGHRAWTESLPLKYRIRKQRDGKISPTDKESKEDTWSNSTSPRSSRSNTTDDNSI